LQLKDVWKCAPADGTNAALKKGGFGTSSGSSKNRISQSCIEAEGVRMTAVGARPCLENSCPQRPKSGQAQTDAIDPSPTSVARWFRNAPKRNLRPTTHHPLLFLRQGLHDLACAFDEKLRQWTERAVFQGHDPNRQGQDGQCHG
jgi:hypothetical protein